MIKRPVAIALLAQARLSSRDAQRHPLRAGKLIALPQAIASP
jgi:hypothetical protein